MFDSKGKIMNEKSEQTNDGGQWVILELFGHKVVAGYLTKDESLGAPLIRLEIPETSRSQGFTRHYHPNAIYSCTYVNEQAARLTAEQVHESPINIYVPELAEVDRLKAGISMWEERFHQAQRDLMKLSLPSGSEEDLEDEDYPEDEVDF